MYEFLCFDDMFNELGFLMFIWLRGVSQLYNWFIFFEDSLFQY